jgi:OOP family OmpA-OmpF porin
VATRKPESSYRLRVLSLGGLAAFALYVVGAPIYNNRIEDDLERRVPEELAAAGSSGITAKFSGQDGTLTCSAPLGDPEGAIDQAYQVWGVRSIELDRSCRVSVGGTPADATATTTAGSTSDTAGTSGDATATTLGTATVDYLTVFDALEADPQFSSFALLVSESEISNELRAESAAPVTVLAPTNEAFEEVPTELLATLRSQPEVRDRVLRGHMISGNLAVDDLVTGSLTALDGTPLEVINEGGLITIGGATVTGGPFTAANGSVYSIDTVLIHDDVAAEPPTVAPATVDVTFDDGTITLSGVVNSEAERQQLVDTAVFGVGTGNVTDTLTVGAPGVSAEQVAAVNELVVALRVNLVSGSVGFDGTEFYVNGTYATDTARDAMAAAAEATGATAVLEPRPAATAEDAAALEASLNAFVAANPILFEPGSAVLDPTAEPILARIASSLIEAGNVTTTVEGHTDSDGSVATNLTLSQQRAAVVADSLVARGVPSDAITSLGFGSEQPVVVAGVEDKAASRRVEFRIAVSS